MRVNGVATELIAYLMGGPSASCTYLDRQALPRPFHQITFSLFPILPHLFSLFSLFSMAPLQDSLMRGILTGNKSMYDWSNCSLRSRDLCKVGISCQLRYLTVILNLGPGWLRLEGLAVLLPHVESLCFRFHHLHLSQLATV